MTRLEKKCLIAAASTHGLLFVILLVGPAFFTPRETAESHRIITVIPYNVTDDATSSGAHTTIATQQPPPPPASQTKDPVSEPVHQEPVHVETPVKTQTKIEKTEEPTPVKVKPQHHLDPSDLAMVKKPVKNTPTTTKATDDTKAREAAAQKANDDRRRAAFNNAIHGIGQSTSKPVIIDAGPPGSGEAMANYSDIVYSIYMAAWTPPASLEDESATVTARVTIARSGKVVHGEITRPSGNPALDRAVRAALDNVNFIAPFPPAATDSQRSYIFNFNLQAKRGLG